ncbi:hypothetical protein ABPG74_000511 [Tetrahymena malaccensis]
MKFEFISIIALILQEYESCGQYIIEQLRNQNIIAYCDDQLNVIADCKSQNYNNLDLQINNITGINQIRFLNSPKLEFSSIIIEDKNNEENSIIYVGQNLECFSNDQKNDQQNIQINQIILQGNSIISNLLILFQNFQNVVINQLMLNLLDDNKIFQIQNAMIKFVDPNNQQLSVQRNVSLNNFQLFNISYFYQYSGLIQAQNLYSFQTYNITLQFSRHIQTFGGALFTLKNIQSVQISQTQIIIRQECVLAVQFGGFIYLSQVNSTEINQFYFENHFNSQDIYQIQQGGIIYSDSQHGKIVFNKIYAKNLNIQGDGGFAYLQDIAILINEVTIINFNVQNNGGAFFFDQIDNQQYQAIINANKLSITNCTSQLVGGAIFGGSFIQLSEIFINSCSSKIGGGFYNSKIKQNLLENIQFKNNKALFYGKDFCQGVQKLVINKIYQYNNNLGEKLNLVYIGNQKNQIASFINGLDYLIQFSVYIEDIVLDGLDNSQTQNNTNNLSYFGFAKAEKTEQKYSENLMFNQGMVTKTFKSINYCEYCYDSVQLQKNPSLSTTCQQCSKDQIQECYGKYSILKPGFWRNSQAVSSSEIFKCSQKPQNCIGGYFEGNQLCAQGHVGVECLECDMYNITGKGYYSKANMYSCTNCSDISFNFGKIIIVLIVVLIVIFTVFKTNFKQQKNYIYKKYLSLMKIIYFGNSYYRLGQSGSYIRIISFYFQIMNIASYFYGSEKWKQLFSFQQDLYNPVIGSSISFDCFLQDIFKNNLDQNISYYQKIKIITLSPFFIVMVSLLPSLLMLLLKKSSWKKFSYAASLILSYSFTTLFCVPVVDILASGIFCKTFNNGEKYAILDLTLKCDDPDRLQFVYSFILPFLIIYSILIPGLIFIALIRNRFRLDKIHSRFLLGFIYVDYKRKYFYWEFIRLSTRYILIIVLYCFYSSTPLIGYFSLAVLIIYSTMLNKYKPYQTERLNKMEQLSITTGGLFLIGYMMKFSLNQESEQNEQILTSIVIITVNILSILFLAYMVSKITISILQPHLYKISHLKAYIFISRYLRCIAFIKYTEKKRKNFQILRNSFKQYLVKIQTFNESEMSQLIHQFTIQPEQGDQTEQNF